MEGNYIDFSFPLKRIYGSDVEKCIVVLGAETKQL